MRRIKHENRPQAPGPEGGKIQLVGIIADSNQSEDMQIIGAEYNPKTGKVKPETIGEAYGSYDFGKKKKH